MRIFGFYLAAAPFQTWASVAFTGNVAFTALAGTKMAVAGKLRNLAFVYYLSPGQLNVQTPSGVAKPAERSPPS